MNFFVVFVIVLVILIIPIIVYLVVFREKPIKIKKTDTKLLPALQLTGTDLYSIGPVEHESFVLRVKHPGTYFDVSLYSHEKDICIFTIPYLKEAAVRIPYDLPQGKYTIMINVVEGYKIDAELIPKRIFYSKLEKYEDVDFKSDERYYNDAAVRFTSHFNRIEGKLNNAMGSKRIINARRSLMITTMKVKPIVGKNQSALILIPNRKKTANVLSKIYIDDKPVELPNRNDKIFSLFTERTVDVEQVLYGVSPNVVYLPIYSYTIEKVREEVRSLSPSVVSHV